MADHWPSAGRPRLFTEDAGFWPECRRFPQKIYWGNRLSTINIQSGHHVQPDQIRTQVSGKSKRLEKTSFFVAQTKRRNYLFSLNSFCQISCGKDKKEQKLLCCVAGQLFMWCFPGCKRCFFTWTSKLQFRWKSRGIHFCVLKNSKKVLKRHWTKVRENQPWQWSRRTAKTIKHITRTCRSVPTVCRSTDRNIQRKENATMAGALQVLRCSHGSV